jgi:hypothetical protein
MSDGLTPEPEQQNSAGSPSSAATSAPPEGAEGGGEGSSCGSTETVADGWRDGTVYTVRKWKVVGTWSYNFESDTCAICRNSLYEPSLEVQAMGDEVAPDHPGRRFARGKPPPPPPTATRATPVPGCAIPCARTVVLRRPMHSRHAHHLALTS